MEEVKEPEEVVTAYDERVVSESDEVEEIVVRGRAKVVPKADTNARRKRPAQQPQAVEQVKLTEKFLEEDEDASSDVRMEGKYDSDEEDIRGGESKYDGGQQQQSRQQGGERAVDGEEEVDEKEQLRRAVALSMTHSVHRMDDEEAEEVREATARPGQADAAARSREQAAAERAFNQHTREQRMLESIAEVEEEMAAELHKQQKADDTDEVMLVERKATTTQTQGNKDASQSNSVNIVSAQHKAARAEEEEETSVVEQIESISILSPIPAPAPPVAPSPTAPQSTSSSPADAAAPRGFVLPSLSSLSTRTAAQPTNLFFAEKEKREQERKQREAAQTIAATARTSTAPVQPTATSSPPSTAVWSSASPPATAPSPSLSAFPASAPIAQWTSATDDPSNAAEPSVDAHLSDIYTDSHVLSSSLARLKSKQAKQQQQVTTAMLEDCRHLLVLFGCPYIIAPAEAEAQCATLETLGLVDGVVTEDSDVFLFGAKHVYRNIFEQKKYAERYRIDEIAAVLGVDRDGLVSLALLLGSDYVSQSNTHCTYRHRSVQPLHCPRC